VINTEAKSELIVENLVTAVLVFDDQLCLNSINTSGENLLLTSYRMLAGSHARDMFPDTSRFVEDLSRSRDSRTRVRERTMELKLPGGRALNVDCTFTPLLNGDRCQGILVELNDTENLSRFLREASLNAQHDAATESLRGMAHEIKNPLGGLRGAAQLLERELDHPDLREYTQIIISEADRLRKLIDRMMTPNGKLQVSRVNIHEILEYVQNLLEAEIGAGLHIERNYDPSLPDLEADREQLLQAILNIFRNAVQAIPDGGRIWLNTRVKRMCTIRQHLHKLALVLEIIDDGPGIPQAIEHRLFYPLVTGRAEGTGLGLSIAQSLIQSNGGMIEHERDDNRTIFRILLPSRSADEPA